jgi:hypothetical protein
MRYNPPYGSPGPNPPGDPYINGNPSTGQQGSIPPAESIEYPQREIVEIIADAGFTPSNSDLKQLARALQTGKLLYGLDTGSTNSMSITLVPAPLAYYEGMRVNVKVNNDITDATVLNVNALGAKSVVGANGAALTSNMFFKNDILSAVYDGTKFQVSNPKTPGPVYLARNLDFYVGGAGASDSNDGLAATVGGGHGPWATLAYAATKISQYNLNGFAITVHVANGSYAQFTHPSASGAGSISWIGNPGAPTSCNISGNTTGLSAIKGNNVGNVTFNGFQLFTSGASVGGDYVCGAWFIGGGSNVSLQNITFGACGGAHVAASAGAVVLFTGNIVCNGGCAGGTGIGGHHVFADDAQVGIQPGTAPALTISAAFSLAGAWIYSTYLSKCNVSYSSQSGAASVTGQKYNASANAIIVSGGTTYPGTVAGATSTGGQYL